MPLRAITTYTPLATRPALRSHGTLPPAVTLVFQTSRPLKSYAWMSPVAVPNGQGKYTISRWTGFSDGRSTPVLAVTVRA